MPKRQPRKDDRQERPGRRKSPARAIMVPKLDGISGILLELGRLYRAARRGEVETQDAARLASILSTMRSALELQHRLGGTLQDTPLISVTVVGEIQVAVMTALEPWPAARRAVAAAVENLANAPAAGHG